MIVLANIVFMAGSLMSALAQSVGVLVGGRAIQGIGGGGLIILVNICVADLFSMRDRPKYYGFLGMVWAIASGLGKSIDKTAVTSHLRIITDSETQSRSHHWRRLHTECQLEMVLLHQLAT